MNEGEKGSHIKEKWHFIKDLGKGGMGSVVLAEDAQKRLVAVKYLKKSILKNRQFFIDRFKSEFSILKELSHPGINKVYDFGFDEGEKQYYFTTEYIEGRPLLKAAGKLLYEEVEELFVQTLRALEYLHTHGIMHSDIKSGNILITEEKKIKLIDFGLASIGSLNLVMGTPSYMAPEVILKNNPDGRADLYSLGVLIYTALTGLNPFKTDKMDETFKRQLNIKPDPPSFYNKDVPSYMDEIISKLLKKNPTERFLSAAHVIRAINFESTKTYPVETKETVLGYMPTGGGLVGRKGEIEEIEKMCISVKEGTEEKFALCINGELGTGKKRLLNELKYFAQLNEFDVITLTATDEATQADFNNRIGELEKNVSRSAIVIVSVLGSISTRKAAVSTVEGLRRLIKHLKVKRALSGVGDMPRVIVAFSSLPEESPLLLHLLEIDEAEDLRTISIKNLCRDETAGYIAALTGVNDPPEILVEEVWSRTDGNPLFISEVTKGLIEKGLLFDDLGRWNKETMEDLGFHFQEIEVPKTVRDILEKIYRNTSEDEKRVLNVMSVWERPVMFEEMAGVDREIGWGVVGALIKQGLIEANKENATYYFKNSLLKELVYEKLYEDEKAGVHEAVVRYLREKNPDDFEAINWHLGHSKKTEAAVDALILLGVEHIGKMRPHDAVHVFNEAKKVMKAGSYRLDDLLLHLGEAYVLTRSYEEAINAFWELIDFLKGGEGLEGKKGVEVMQKLGLAHLRAGDVKAAKEILVSVDSIISGQKHGDVLRLKNRNLLGRVAFLEGRFDDAIDLYRRSKEEWSRLPGEDKALIINNDLAHVMLSKGEYETAEKEFTSDIKFFKEIGAESELERAYYAMAVLKSEIKETEMAVKYFNNAVEIAKRISDSELLLRAYNGLGTVFSQEEKGEESLYWYERGLDLATRTGDESSAAVIAFNIGLIKLDMKKGDEALNHFMAAQKIFLQSKAKTELDRTYLVRTYAQIADIFRMKKEYGKAQYYLKKAADLISTSSALNEQWFWVRKVKYLLAKDMGENQSAEDILRELRREATTDIARRELEGFDEQKEEKTVSEEIEREISIIDIHSDLDYGPSKEDDMKEKYFRYILEINKYLSGEHDLEFVLKTILKYAIELSKAEAGFVVLEDNKGELRILSSCNVEINEDVSRLGLTIARTTIEKDEVIITKNALEDERFNRAESVILLGLKSVISVPVHVKKRVIGVLYLEDRSGTGTFDSADKEVITSFADQAGIAIENARLFAKHEDTEESLKERLEESYVHIKELDAKVKIQTRSLEKIYKLGKMISLNNRMKEIFSLLERVADTELSVCVVGESGTGKELVAQAMHFNSSRRKGPFVAVNCGAIPASLIESELFGYKSGAFTGAVRDKKGYFEEAEGGTIFLDEIGELDISLQAKLLRVIQEREFVRIGDTKVKKCDVRLICATNRRLDDLIKEKQFREDLYYRISEINVELPPLRERLEDIPILIEQFVKDYCAQHNISRDYKVDPRFIKACISHKWPGNIRELENTVRVATALSNKDTIKVEFLPEDHFLKSGGSERIRETAPVPLSKNTINIDDKNIYAPEKTWRSYEGEIIAAVYKLNGFNASKTAQSLNMAVATVYKKIGDFGLKDESNPLYSSGFIYTDGIPLEEYITKIFEAAWKYYEKRPYHAARALGISHGYFYKVMKRFG